MTFSWPIHDFWVELLSFWTTFPEKKLMFETSFAALAALDVSVPGRAGTPDRTGWGHGRGFQQKTKKRDAKGKKNVGEMWRKSWKSWFKMNFPSWNSISKSQPKKTTQLVLFFSAQLSFLAEVLGKSPVSGCKWRMIPFETWCWNPNNKTTIWGWVLDHPFMVFLGWFMGLPWFTKWFGFLYLI